ncbi:anti-anti-sigma factor [Streptomyces sp. DvalAA-14]|uniref:anti-sigma factor antagonist n=1 Tax=unclassified Streptomyces TaxID=2593676 RepID=UPI00081B76CF|nr:anti-sigma factor antagonist [Streptomyces sp. DvalAA-14]MYS20366.1 anti-sigma factor antagonist [Streptomyces sp. SID4948]SCD67244.1 anti-anti-sigma factor [Streptomyces sp. DvalAA-14]
MHHQGEPPEHTRRFAGAVPPPSGYARTYRVRDTVVVELSGELDLASAEYVDAHLEAAAQWPAPLEVVLDLRPVEFIDCFGLSLLVRARRRIVDRGGRIRMVCGDEQTRKLITVTGLDDAFRPVRTLEQALEQAVDRAPEQPQES